MSRFKVWLHSKPAPGLTFYEGIVTVPAFDQVEAKAAAV